MREKNEGKKDKRQAKSKELKQERNASLCCKYLHL